MWKIKSCILGEAYKLYLKWNFSEICLQGGEIEMAGHNYWNSTVLSSSAEAAGEWKKHCFQPSSSASSTSFSTFPRSLRKYQSVADVKHSLGYAKLPLPKCFNRTTCGEDSSASKKGVGSFLRKCFRKRYSSANNTAWFKFSSRVADLIEFWSNSSSGKWLVKTPMTLKSYTNVIFLSIVFFLRCLFPTKYAWDALALITYTTKS